MTKLGYNLTTGGILTLAMCGSAIVWMLADRVYVTGDQASGWLIGIAGVALPAVSLLACAMWLRSERRRGHELAKVAWLWWAFGSSAFIWAGLLLFSLM